MVDRQFVRLRCYATVLAHEPIALEQVPAAERDARVRQPVVSRQNDHFGNTNFLRNGLDKLSVLCGRLVGPIAPVIQPIVINVDYLCAVAEYQGKCATDSGHVDRLPVAVENQRRLVQHLGHLWFLRNCFGYKPASHYDMDWRIYTVRIAHYNVELAMI